LADRVIKLTFLALVPAPQAWARVKEDYASVVLARMYRSFKSRKEQGRLMWKIQARQQKSQAELYALFARRLQCWWRVVCAQKCFIARLRHHVEVVPDLVERRLYFSKQSGDCISQNRVVPRLIGTILIIIRMNVLGSHLVEENACMLRKTMF